MSQFKWSIIEQYVNDAERGNEVILQFQSPRQAELFTFAFYNYRRRKLKGKDLKINREGEQVILYRPVEIYIRPLKLNLPIEEKTI